jgi:hypothetical protein
MSTPARLRDALLVLFFVLTLNSTASAQWKTGYESPGFTDGAARCAIEFDGKLAIGGDFLGAGCIDSPGVVLCDLERFYPTGRELFARYNRGVVNALAVYDGSLVAAGSFHGWTGVPLSNVARWTGTEWVSLAGPYGNGPLYGGGVDDLAIYDGDLIAVGSFTSSKATDELAGVARWDGESWLPMGSRPPEAQALAVYDGELYCGLSRWTGSDWAPISVLGSSSDTITALDVVDGGLAIGGTFETLNGTTVNGSALFDGQNFFALGDGATTTYDPGFGLRYPGGVAGFASFDGSTWMMAPNYRQYDWYFGLSQRDGEWWRPSSEVDWPNEFNPYGALTVFQNRLVALTGNPETLIDLENAAAQSGVTFDGTTWSPLATGRGTPVFVEDVATFGGTTWTVAGDQGVFLQNDFGVSRIERGVRAHAVSATDSGVLVGGSIILSLHVPVPAPYLAEYDAIGERVDLLYDWEGLGGWVTQALRWNDAFLCAIDHGEEYSSWDIPIGELWLVNEDLRSVSYQYPPSLLAQVEEPVDALTLHQGRPWLATGGEVLRLDQGPTLTLIGTFNGTIHGLISDGNRLVVGGEFTSVNAVNSPNLAVFDGTHWIAPPTPDGPVYALARDEDGVVYVGGEFENVGSLHSPNLAAMRGMSVGAFDGAPDDRVTSISTSEHGIVVAGEFTSVGEVCSVHLAEYDGAGITLPVVEGPAEDGGTPLPLAVQLLAPSPNPFNPRVTLAFDLPRTSATKLEIYDTAGRLIRTVFTGDPSAGRHEFVWSGIDQNGREVASGVYFAVLTTPDRRLHRKLALVR